MIRDNAIFSANAWKKNCNQRIIWKTLELAVSAVPDILSNLSTNCDNTVRIEMLMSTRYNGVSVLVRPAYIGALTVTNARQALQNCGKVLIDSKPERRVELVRSLWQSFQDNGEKVIN